MRGLCVYHLASKHIHHLGFPEFFSLCAQLDEKVPNRLLHFQISATSTLVIKWSKIPTLVYVAPWLS